MTTPPRAPIRVGVHIAEDHDYLASPHGNRNMTAEERARVADGSWSVYQLTTVVECPHCRRRHSTDSLGGVAVATTSLVDAIVWADDPRLAGTDDALHAQIRALIHSEQANPTPPSEWVPLPTI